MAKVLTPLAESLSYNSDNCDPSLRSPTFSFSTCDEEDDKIDLKTSEVLDDGELQVYADEYEPAADAEEPNAASRGMLAKET